MHHITTTWVAIIIQIYIKWAWIIISISKCRLISFWICSSRVSAVSNWSKLWLNNNVFPISYCTLIVFNRSGDSTFNSLSFLVISEIITLHFQQRVLFYPQCFCLWQRCRSKKTNNKIRSKITKKKKGISWISLKLNCKFITQITPYRCFDTNNCFVCNCYLKRMYCNWISGPLLLLSHKNQLYNDLFLWYQLNIWTLSFSNLRIRNSHSNNCDEFMIIMLLFVFVQFPKISNLYPYQKWHQISCLELWILVLQLVLQLYHAIVHL